MDVEVVAAEGASIVHGGSGPVNAHRRTAAKANRALDFDRPAVHLQRDADLSPLGAGRDEFAAATTAEGKGKGIDND